MFYVYTMSGVLFAEELETDIKVVRVISLKYFSRLRTVVSY